jgi:hypothetical protein
MRLGAKYNTRLARGRRPSSPADNLIGTLDRIGKDLGAAPTPSTADRPAFRRWFDLRPTTVSINKGTALRERLCCAISAPTFKDVLDERSAGKIWERMVASMMEGRHAPAAGCHQRRPNALVEPNHLTAQGFYLLRARTQLEELTDILQK